MLGRKRLEIELASLAHFYVSTFAPLCHNAACRIVAKKISQKYAPVQDKMRKNDEEGCGMPPREDSWVSRTQVCSRNGMRRIEYGEKEILVKKIWLMI